MPDALAVEDLPHRDLRRTGRPLPPDWRDRFLKFYAARGVRWRAAKFAGVSHDTVLRHERDDPTFARQVEEARQEYADSQELNLHRLATKENNVVGSIVLLKKHRPAEYIEKNLTVTATVHARLDSLEGKQLLQAMLGSQPPALPERRDG